MRQEHILSFIFRDKQNGNIYNDNIYNRNDNRIYNRNIYNFVDSNRELMEKIKIIKELDDVLSQLKQEYRSDEQTINAHFDRVKETKQKIDMYEYIRKMVIGDEDIPMCPDCGRVLIEILVNGKKVCEWCHNIPKDK